MAYVSRMNGWSGGKSTGWQISGAYTRWINERKGPIGLCCGGCSTYCPNPITRVIESTCNSRLESDSTVRKPNGFLRVMDSRLLVWGYYIFFTLYSQFQLHNITINYYMLQQQLPMFYSCNLHLLLLLLLFILLLFLLLTPHHNHTVPPHIYISNGIILVNSPPLNKLPFPVIWVHWYNCISMLHIYIYGPTPILYPLRFPPPPYTCFFIFHKFIYANRFYYN